MVDERLNHHNDHLETLDYESDHKAILLKISKGRGPVLELLEAPPEFILNYSKTNWENFRKGLKHVYGKYKNENGIRGDEPIIPDNINLSNEKIEKFIN